jgi:hypothetical protein
MEKRQLRVELLGTSFTVQSDEDADHLARVSACLRAKVEEVRSRYTLASPLTIALLAALNIADDLVREREGRVAGGPAAPLTDGDEAEAIAAGLIERIDEELASEP